MKDYDLARFNMVEQQIRPWDVHNPALLEALKALPREQYLPEKYQGLAYSDTDIDTGDAVLIAPKTLARMVQELKVDRQSSVLQIGAASGYSLALLGELADRVDCLLTDGPNDLLAANTSKLGSAVALHEDEANLAAQYTAVLLHAPVRSIDHSLLGRLVDDGCLVAVVGSGAVNELMVYRKTQEGFTEHSVIDTALPPIKQSAQHGKTFEF